jgi:hypothetical protein
MRNSIKVTEDRGIILPRNVDTSLKVSNLTRLQFYLYASKLTCLATFLLDYAVGE